MKYRPFHILLVFLVLWGCSERFPSQPVGNQAPDTFLSLFPDSSLRRTTSQQHLRWWGVDPDGFVIGFVFSFDSTNWTFTPKNDSLFGLRLNTTDTTYIFHVSAVDNGGNGRRDASTPWGPEPYTDLNGNNQYDSEEPFVDFGAVDPTPASLQYPIRNTPPTVAFLLNSNVPETTYAVATFQWNGTDLDGNETIERYYYALDDTTVSSSWRELPGSFNRVTLFRNRVITSNDPSTFRNDSLTQGDHVFFLRAKDIAGAFSPIVRMPDTGKTWHVKSPKGDFLIVDDYLPTDISASFYNTMFDTVLGGRLGVRDIFDIKKGATNVKRGDFVPPLINPTFTETLKLFKYIFWYSDNSPSLDIAQSCLPDVKRSGGKVLFTSGFPENVSGQGSLVDFAPIENVESSTFTTILSQGDTVVSFESGYPTLIRDNLGTAYAFPRGLLPKIDARVLYRMQLSSRWSGQPIMGVKDADQASFVLLGILLHRFGSPPDNVARLLRKVYRDEFGVQ
ncbi:MAG: hypothetical protein HYY49_00355 [Ignavibacteriales bacterium]|nr:hypothetical protein [Ignavibacteriales bacterium]